MDGSAGAGREEFNHDRVALFGSSRALCLSYAEASWTQRSPMLSPPHPVAQCLARAADLLGRVDRRPLRSALGLVVQDIRTARARTSGNWGNSLCHGSILSGVGASGKPGTVQSTNMDVKIVASSASTRASAALPGRPKLLDSGSGTGQMIHPGGGVPWSRWAARSAQLGAEAGP